MRMTVCLAALCAVLQLSACATAGGYEGYGGYHTYKRDGAAKARMAALAAFFAPVMALPALYFLNQAYLHNKNLHDMFLFMGLDGFFKKLGGVLPR